MASQIRSPAYAEIEVNQRPLGDLSALIREVTVQLKRSTSGTATIVLDSFRDELGQWAVQDAAVLVPWAEVKIFAHFDGDRDEVLRGYIREVRLEYPEDMSAARVTVTVQDELIKLDRTQLHGPVTREGKEVSDGALACEYAKSVDLACEADEGMRAGALQINGTAAKFLRERAEANGFEFFAREGCLHFHAPRLKADVQPEIKVYAGPNTSCVRFNVLHDGQRPDGVQVAERQTTKEKPTIRVYDPTQPALGTKPLTSEGRGLKPFVWTIDRPTGASDAEVECRARAKANEAQFKIVGEGLLDGSQYGHVLLPHRPVSIDGIGVTYGALYYVDEVTHKFTKGIYEQQFKVISNATD